MMCLAFDTETTGLIESRLKQVKFQPYVIQFVGWLIDLDEKSVIEKLELFIRPPDPELLTKHITDVTRITWEMLADACPFQLAAPKIIGVIEKAEAVAAHNLIFDMDMLNLEAKRSDLTINWPERQICTVEASGHLKGRRLKLVELYHHLFGEDFADAHDARVDTAALVKILFRMRELDAI